MFNSCSAIPTGCEIKISQSVKCYKNESFKSNDTFILIQDTLSRWQDSFQEFRLLRHRFGMRIQTCFSTGFTTLNLRKLGVLAMFYSSWYSMSISRPVLKFGRCTNNRFHELSFRSTEFWWFIPASRIMARMPVKIIIVRSHWRLNPCSKGGVSCQLILRNVLSNRSHLSDKHEDNPPVWVCPLSEFMNLLALE